MRLVELAALYAVIGAGCAVARLAWRAAPSGRGLDAVMLGLLWPLFGPFFLLREHGDAAGVALPAPDAGEAAFLTALRRAADTPLGDLLPDEGTARALGARLRVAASKIVEIDRILARPAFSEDGARARVHALRARGASDNAITTASMRLHNIHRLRGLRDRFADELDEVGELLAQLTTQAEIVRLAGSADASAGELVSELIARVEGLDQVLDHDGDGLAADVPAGVAADLPADVPADVPAGVSV